MVEIVLETFTLLETYKKNGKKGKRGGPVQWPPSKGSKDRYQRGKDRRPGRALQPGDNSKSSLKELPFKLFISDNSKSSLKEHPFKLSI